MKIAVFDDCRIGVVNAGGIHDVSAALAAWQPNRPWMVNEFIERFDELRPAVLKLCDEVPIPLADVRLRAPVPRPINFLAAPLNYRAHQSEMTGVMSSGIDTAERLGFFVKAVGSISGPADAIELPNRPERRFDYEGEIAVVIGRRAAGVPAERALEHVFGYTLLLDMTMRMTEDHREERTMRKSFSTFSPMGPWITTHDEAGDPSALSLRLWVNGELRQTGALTDLIVNVPEMISRASAVLPLEAGDVYTTGSPAGVGQIVPGDVIEVESPSIGRMRVEVAARAW